MNDNNEVWAYDEPHPSGGNIHVTMTKAQAIAYMDVVYPGVYKAKDSEKAFQEWVAVHWAYKCEDVGEEEGFPAIIEAWEFERSKDREKIQVLEAELSKLRSEFETKRVEIQTIWKNIKDLWAYKKAG